jgi:hypothetical protein
MKPLPRIRPLFSVLASAIALTLYTTPVHSDPPVASQAAAPSGPSIKVVSPGGAANLMRPGGEDRILIVIEITDRNGAGLDADDDGTPRFEEPGPNVSLFRRHILRQSQYLNHLGQNVVQLISEVPIKDLTYRPDAKITPPMNSWSAELKGRKKGFAIPLEAMNDVADFVFRVRDRTGAVSPAEDERNSLWVGVAWNLYTPPPEKDTDPDGAPAPAAPNPEAASSPPPPAPTRSPDSPPAPR